MMFSDRYIQKVVNTKSHLCVGLDPILENFPSYILKKAESIYGKTPRGAGYAIFEFNKIPPMFLENESMWVHLSYSIIKCLMLLSILKFLNCVLDVYNSEHTDLYIRQLL
mgnify:CR=1 FL=1